MTPNPMSSDINSLCAAKRERSFLTRLTGTMNEEEVQDGA